MIKLIQGDCLTKMDTLIEAGVKVDAVITDPPYGTTACKWDIIIPIEPMWERLNKLVKPNGVIVLFGAEPFSSLLRVSNIKNYKYDWVWAKNKVTGFLNAKKQPLRSHENILVFYKKQATYNPQKTRGHKPVNAYTKRTSDGDTVGYTKLGISGGGSTKRYPKTIQPFHVVNQDGTNDGGKFHPTQKPVALMEYLIKTYTNKHETVLDFAMGSATTLVACRNTNRNGIGIESNEEHFEVAKKRLTKTSDDK